MDPDHAQSRSLQRARATLKRLDPEILEAATDVDRELLRWMLSLSPRARLRASGNATGALCRIRRAAS